MNDIIDISMDFNDDWNKSKKSSNFGSGIELLMNDKRPENKISNNVEFDDITDLENDLNNLVNEPINIENFDNSSHVRFNNNSLGESTINLDTTDKTWDGYGKFNDIPIAPEVQMPNIPKMSATEILKEKVKYLRKFEALEKKGVQLTKKYDMDSNLDEMKGEYEMIMDDKSKQNSIKFQANMLMTIINGIEFLNQKFDPFDVNLEGWGEQVQENITDYDEIFAALHDKWKSKANISPELQLLFQLGGSAVMVHMTNSMFKSSLPGVDDILKQNPDLMRQFANAAVNQMPTEQRQAATMMNNMAQMGRPRTPPPPDVTLPPYAPRPTTNGDTMSHTSLNSQTQNKSRGKSIPAPQGLDEILNDLKSSSSRDDNISEIVSRSSRKRTIFQKPGRSSSSSLNL